MEPKDFARLLLRRKSTIAMATLIVIATVVFGSLRRAPVYAAQCEVLFKGIGFDLSENDSQGIEPFGSIATNLDIASGPQVTALAAERLGWLVGDVAGRVNVTLKPETQIIVFRVADTPPVHLRDTPDVAERAGKICNAYGEAYIEYRRLEGAKSYRRELDSIQNDQINTQHDLDIAREAYKVAKNSGDSALTVEKLNTFNNLVALKGELDRRHTAIASRIKRGLEGEGGEMFKFAGPGALTGSDLKRSALLGLIVGLMFGVGIALIREYLDDTVKDKEQASRELGLPVLANLPASSELDGFDGPQQSAIEAARTLRATLAAYGFPNEKRMLMVASSLSKRRSTTLAALAGAVAESGRSVLVIGSDLRSGRTHEAFGIANTVGLANVVRGQVPLRNAIRPAPGLENVYVLPCGPVIGSPGEILSSEAMAFVLREAREWADVVLLDAPPVLAAADASILGAYADGVVLVVSAGRTSRGKAAESKEQLAAAGARVLGAVLIGGDDERDRDSIDDLNSFISGGFGYDGGSAYAGAGVGGGDWYGDDVITMTARTEPQARRSSDRPSKKVSAAGVDSRPRRLSPPSVPASARTAAPRRASAEQPRAPRRATAERTASPRRTSAERSASPRRSSVDRPASPARKRPSSKASPARKTTARKATSARTASARATARTASPARKTTTRKTTARKASPARKTARTVSPARKTTARKASPARKTTATARTRSTRSTARTSKARASTRARRTTRR